MKVSFLVLFDSLNTSCSCAVQISDLHINMFPDHKSKNRLERFREFAKTVPQVIDPAFVVVTGDLIHGLCPMFL